MQTYNMARYIAPVCETVLLHADESILAQSYYYGNGGNYSDNNDNGWYL